MSTPKKSSRRGRRTRSATDGAPEAPKNSPSGTANGGQPVNNSRGVNGASHKQSSNGATPPQSASGAGAGAAHHSPNGAGPKSPSAAEAQASVHLKMAGVIGVWPLAQPPAKLPPTAEECAEMARLEATTTVEKGEIERATTTLTMLRAEIAANQLYIARPGEKLTNKSDPETRYPDRRWQIVGASTALVGSAAATVYTSSKLLVSVFDSEPAALAFSVVIPASGVFFHLLHEASSPARRLTIEQWILRAGALGVGAIVTTLALATVDSPAGSILRSISSRTTAVLGVACLDVALSFGLLGKLNAWLAERTAQRLTTAQERRLAQQAALEATLVSRNGNLNTCQIRLAELKRKEADHAPYIAALNKVI